MFHLIPYNTKIDFMRWRMPMALFSIGATVAALYFIAVKGFNYGVDFAGGVELILRIPAHSGVDVEKVREGIESIGIKSPSVQSFGDTSDKEHRDIMVHFAADFLDEAATKTKVENAFSSLKPADLKAGEALITKFRFVGLEKAYVSFARPLPLEIVQKTLKAIPFGMTQLTEVSPFGRETQNEYQLLFSSVSQVVVDGLTKQLALGDGAKIEALKVDFVGAKVGADLRMAALLSLLITTALVFVYIFVRFDLVYAPGVVAALIHDVVIAAGVFAYSGMEFDLTIVAALLTLAGYSINDTIIVYDRIREVASTMKGKSFSDIINLAVNQTLSRTIITSGLVFLATLALYLKGGPVIHGFALCFLVGIIVGTYSSVFVAAPAVLWMRKLVGNSEQKAGRVAA